MSPNSEMTCLIHWTDVPGKGVRKKIIATDKECEDLAKMLGVVAFRQVEASFEITRWRGSGLKVIADIVADVDQNCVVSLEPISSCEREQAEWFFKSDARSKKDIDNDAVLQIDPMGEDPADLLVEGRVDLWQLLIEHLCLMIDPFKRAASVDFEAVYNEVTDPSASENSKASPFAILKTMGKKS